MQSHTKAHCIAPRHRQIALIRYKYMYILLLPGLIYLFLFHYLPMAGLVVAFQDYKVFLGISKSPFVGFSNFSYLLSSKQFMSAVKNTFIISGYKILFGFPAPIIIALLINEIRVRFLQRTIQTILYLPHFLSWVIMFGLLFNILSEYGPINQLIKAFGGKPIFFLSDTKYFRLVVIASDIWKEVGWSAIIYLAALAGIPPELYEAAHIDGASRAKSILFISLPSLMPTIIVMLLLRIGGILNAGFEQILTLYNASVFSVGDIIDTYVYRIGLLQTKFGISTAAGMFKSVIALILVTGANYLAKKMDQEALF